VGDVGEENGGDIVDLGEASLSSPALILEMVLRAGDMATSSGSRSLKRVVLSAENDESEIPLGTTPNCSESARRAS